MALQTRKPTGAVPWPLILIEGEEKSGKAQPYHSQIATPGGWTTMGELVAGDHVIGTDGKAAVVTAVHERGERHVWRLTFSDGAAVEACDEHLWATWTSSDLHRTYANGPKKGQRNTRPAKIRTTAEIRNLLLNGTVVHIPVTAAVSYASDAEPLPLDPYALGLLLGDGGLTKRSYPQFTTTDAELSEALAAALPGADSMSPKGGTITFGIRGGATTAALRALGLMERGSAEKFIPERYLRASVEDRLALLQGLMDTDGGMEWKSITYTSVSLDLATQLQELVRSLGGTCSMSSKQPSYRDASGVRIQCKTAYCLRMRLPLGVCPFRLARKAARWTETRPAFRTPPRRTVKAVDYVGLMPTRCIAVDAADHLYLTDDFIVTHNTWSCAELTASPQVGRCFWIDMGEGAADEYGAIPGADYEVVVHDGSWAALYQSVAEIHAEAGQALARGEKPVVLVIDTMTSEWDLLKDWATDRAKSSRSNRAKLERDPNAEINVSANYWNDANARHRNLMRLLKTFPGIALMTAHGKPVAAMGPDGQPVEGKKEHKVEAQKTLGADASCWLRLFREEQGVIVGGRSVPLKFRPGDKPRLLAADWTLEGVIFDVLKCDPATARARDLVAPKADAVTPEQIRDEAVHPRTDVDRVRGLYREAKRLGYDDVFVVNETGDEENLVALVERVGLERTGEPAPQRPAANGQRAAKAADPALTGESDPWATDPAPANSTSPEQGSGTLPPANGSGDGAAWAAKFRQELSGAPEETLGRLQRDIGSAIGRKIITAQTGDLLSEAVRNRRKELAGQAAA